jgi:hypothetical protein
MMTYLESLKVAWLILWRMNLMMVAFIGVPLLMTFNLFNFVPSETLIRIVPFLGVAIMIFFIYPLTIRMALQKKFQGFHLQIVRDSN